MIHKEGQNEDWQEHIMRTDILRSEMTENNDHLDKAVCNGYADMTANKTKIG